MVTNKQQRNATRFYLVCLAQVSRRVEPKIRKGILEMGGSGFAIDKCYDWIWRLRNDWGMVYSVSRLFSKTKIHDASTGRHSAIALSFVEKRRARKKRSPIGSLSRCFGDVMMMALNREKGYLGQSASRMYTCGGTYANRITFSEAIGDSYNCRM